MQRALDFDKTPALAVPLPFLLNVPLFAALAGVLATWAGPQAFVSRWSPITLALTHLWTLGVLASAMLGALLQILAVACNVPTLRARGVSALTHAALTLGTASLVLGFLTGWPALWRIAVPMLGVAFGLYLLAVSWSLWRHRAQAYAGAREILVPIRGAMAALAITVLIGLVLASFLGLGMAPPAWVDFHVLWGLPGWGGLLVMGMSFQLLPIFQATELYPRSITRILPPAILALLLARTATVFLPAVSPRLTELPLACGYTVWGVVTLQRILTRKHPATEATSLFWYTGMACLLACSAAWPWSGSRHAASVTFAVGTLMIVGVLGSIVNGMLYKIIPFLLWKHAQDALVIPDADPARFRLYAKLLPKMVRYVPPRHARAQWAVHVAVILSWTLASMGWRPAAHAAGPLLLVSTGGLAWNIGQALRLYRRTVRALSVLAHA